MATHFKFEIENFHKFVVDRGIVRVGRGVRGAHQRGRRPDPVHVHHTQIPPDPGPAVRQQMSQQTGAPSPAPRPTAGRDEGHDSHVATSL